MKDFKSIIPVSASAAMSFKRNMYNGLMLEYHLNNLKCNYNMSIIAMRYMSTIVYCQNFDE
jgi:hypothetical protein